MRHFALTLTLLLVSTSLAVAQNRPVSAPPDSARGQAAAQFQQEHGPDWQISWHKKAGTPATLLGGTARGYAGPPKQAGRAFLRAHKTLFGVQNVRRGLEVASSSHSENGSSRVQYRQVYKGIPVLYSGYLVAFNPEGAVHYVSGDYYPDLQVDTSPKLQSRDVIEKMQSDLGKASSFKIRQEPLLSIFVDRRGEKLTAHLAYETRAERRDPLKAYKYVIDAQTGAVLQKISLTNEILAKGAPANGDPIAESRAAGTARMVPGTGEVYLTNPLHGSPVSVTLHRLDNVSPQVLEGDNIAVANEEEPEAESPTGDFTYSPSNTHFDEVMTYYHSDEFEAWLIGDLGMATNRLSCQISAETHDSQYYARTFPSACEIYYGDGDNSASYGNPTRERSIITHEYMHDVSQTYNNLEQDQDAESLDEGYSDFFAVADRHANTGVTSGRLAASVGFAPERTVDNNYQLSQFRNGVNLTNDPFGNVDEHDGGVVLAGALWDFKQSINDAALAAEIILASLSNLDSNPSFYDARTAMIAAANSTGNSQYECDIKLAFTDHGIGEAFSATLSGPYALSSGQQGTWSVSVGSCGPGSPSYAWEYQPTGSNTWQSKSCSGSSCSHTFINTDPNNATQYGGIRVTVTKGSYTNVVGRGIAVNCDNVICPMSANMAEGGQGVALRDLEARSPSSGTVALTWKTTRSLPTSRFRVQHRADSTASWSTLGTVEASDGEQNGSEAGLAYRFQAEELEVGTHQFRLAYAPSGAAKESTWTSKAVTATLELKSAYELSVYPSPVQKQATVELAVRERQDVTVRVYDVLGRQVTTLHEGALSEQEQHRLSLNAGRLGLPSGSYFVRVRGEGFVASRRLTVVR